ncbi:Processive diacylglycerol beta-glucosyltransferase [Planktothrix tepida]|uniref:Monogalactosyldiacylglycerol synthase n=2 Tax=Planktothrix TaxID=54304 RepID=A0A1J1LFZ8_9CYAN|nr:MULTISPECIES: glycosyltransferase [Planktothrix]CAD5918940.1 Processive diacylglycerol beta-glucosyltransferase [Planktothrix tepida]CAD5984311.1 Processive diacylglycerol beta-glucosyltransferase [Planktothrix pseudagardhii]CUR30820.1 Monogalactosyldiacylglycerol synthase [Planktothrix tepida PCC 9214]
MTHILILYSSLGAGHNSAAKALNQAFSHFTDVTVTVEDALDYASSIYRNTVTSIYKQLSEKAPQIYRAYYEGTDLEDLERSLELNIVTAKLERVFFRKLRHFIEKVNPDAIVCVQQIPSRLLQLLEEEERISKPHYVVITDVIAHSSWINKEVDGYYLPNDLTADFMIKRGVDPEILHVTGIPIKLEILEPKSQVEMRERHDLPTNKPVVTIFGGGLHYKRVRLMVSQLMDNLKTGTLIVAAGRNEQLLDSLAELDSTPDIELRKLGLIDYVDDLAVASDLVITKAGGLIVSEVLARGTPMIIVDPFPGQEEWNADLIVAAGAGVQLRLPEMVAPCVKFLLNHSERLSQMQTAALELGEPRAALNIAEHILSQTKH